MTALLVLTGSRFAGRTCVECVASVYGKDGKVVRRPARDPKGKPQPRSATAGLECADCPKIPPECPPHPAYAVEPTARSRRALGHYLACRAVNWQTPDAADSLVQRHAAVIRAVELEAAEARERRRLEAMGVAIARAVRGRS